MFGCTFSGVAGKVGCPTSDLGCRTAPKDLNIDINLVTSATTGIRIVAFTTYETKTVLEFDSNILGTLTDGDIISIDPTTITVGIDRRVQGSWTGDERYAVSRLTGIYEFQDLVKSGEAGHYLVGLKVSTVVEANGINPSKCRVSKEKQTC